MITQELLRQIAADGGLVVAKCEAASTQVLHRTDGAVLGHRNDAVENLVAALALHRQDAQAGVCALRLDVGGGPETREVHLARREVLDTLGIILGHLHPDLDGLVEDLGHAVLHQIQHRAELLDHGGGLVRGVQAETQVNRGVRGDAGEQQPETGSTRRKQWDSHDKNSSRSVGYRSRGPDAASRQGLTLDCRCCHPVVTSYRRLRASLESLSRCALAQPPPRHSGRRLHR